MRFLNAALVVGALMLGGFQATADHSQQNYAGHTIVFFELPVSDMNRARTFYETILAATMTTETHNNYQMAFFPAEEGKITGALVMGAGMKSSADGAIVYLNGGHDLTTILNRVVPAGGTVLIPKTEIPGVGFFAHFVDTEGNRVGLFSAN